MPVADIWPRFGNQDFLLGTQLTQSPTLLLLSWKTSSVNWRENNYSTSLSSLSKIQKPQWISVQMHFPRSDYFGSFFWWHIWHHLLTWLHAWNRKHYLPGVILEQTNPTPYKIETKNWDFFLYLPTQLHRGFKQLFIWMFDIKQLQSHSPVVQFHEPLPYIVVVVQFHEA